jgi:glutathione S-transferase
MGRKPSATEDAATREGTAGRFSERKVEWCDDYLQTHGDEPVLVRAYRAKRAKELSAAETLFSVESMTAAHAQANAAIAVLEDKLSDGDAPWLFGPAPTMADLFWGIELIRMERTGVAALRDGRLPRVARLALASAALPAVREAVLEWPGAVF